MWAIAGGTAGVLTLFDLDRVFYVPREAKQKFALYFWWWGFILANGLLAVGLYFGVKNLDTFKDWSAPLLALTVGASYLAIIHAKFTTFSLGGKDVPFGF